MGKTFEAIERAKREKDTRRVIVPAKLKERREDAPPEVPVTLVAAEEKQSILPTSFEQYHQLKVNLLNRYPDLKHKVIMIASSTENEGSTTTAVNLARALATDDKVRVLLLDGNLRSSSLHQVFGLNNRNGLSNILCGQGETQYAVKNTDINNLFVLTSGGNTPLLGASTDGHVLDSLLDQFKKDFDFVIVDSAPVTAYPDSIILCSKVDGVIFVVEAEKARWEVAQQAKERLRAAGAKILGGVLSKRKHHIPKAIYRRL